MKVFDLHCDTITALETVQADLDNEMSAVNLHSAAWGNFEAYAQCFAAFLSDNYRGEAAIEKWNRIYGWFERQLALYPDKIQQVRCGSDLRKIEADGKIAAILTTESGAAFAGELGRIAELREKGCLITSLTWNGATELAGGVYTPEIGLTDFGKEAVKEMERVGMVVDISHMCDKAVDDFLKIAQKPFAATHSNCRSVCNAMRNLTDDYIREMVDRGCLAGINYLIYFLREGTPELAGYEDVARHVEHFLNLGGENIIALGSDFDGATVPESFNQVGKLGSLYDYLCGEFGAGITDKIFYDNARDFFERNL